MIRKHRATLTRDIAQTYIVYNEKKFFKNREMSDETRNESQNDTLNRKYNYVQIFYYSFKRLIIKFL